MSLGTSAAMVASLVSWIDWVDFGVGPPPLGVLLFEQALVWTSMVTPSRMEVHGRPPRRGRLCLIVLLSRSGFVCRIVWRTGPRREPLQVAGVRTLGRPFRWPEGWALSPGHRLGRLKLQRQLRALEQALQPAQDLRVGQGQLLEGAVLDVGGQLVQLDPQFRRQGFLQLLVDLVQHALQVAHRAGFGPDPPGLLQHLPGHAGDTQEPLRIDGARPGQRGPLGWLLGLGWAGSLNALGVAHRVEITPTTEDELHYRQSMRGR